MDSKPLVGVAVVLFDDAGKKVAQTTTVEDGSFLLPSCPGGRYQVQASTRGFKDHAETVNLSPGMELMLTIALQLKGLTESIEVVDRAADTAPENAGTRETIRPRLVDVEPVKGDTFQAMLPLVPGVVRGPDGRINVKGASAVQSALVVSSSNAADLSTGNPGFELPADAIESVDALPNPYSAEYGRFSAGVTQIQTHKGEARWDFLLNNFMPRYKLRDGTLMGIEHYTPRLSFSGPLYRDHLYLAQSFQYRLIRTPVPAQPVLQRDQSLESFDSFTRLDANLTARHLLVATFAVFPRKLDFVNLNAFNPREVTPNLHNRGVQVGLRETAVLDSQQVLETTFDYRAYDADVFGQGYAPMRISPQGNGGNFFNRQARRTRTIQLTANYTRLLAGFGGRHLLKVGADLLSSSLRGSDASGEVNIYRADSTLNTRIEYSGQSRQKLRATSLGAFVQDHWRVGERWSLELGLRVDRGAVPSRVDLAPRAGVVFSVIPGGRGILRGGAGFFYEQTPMNVAAFEGYETQTITRFAGDGLTPEGASVAWRHRSDPDLQTPRSYIWNIEYDQRLSERWLARVNHLQRSGRHEYLVDPVTSDSGSEYLLSSRGRSHYWEVELSLLYFRNDNFQMSWSYIRSRSEADLNNYDLCFGNFRNPVIRPNEYSLTSVDAPHRLLYRAVVPLPYKITFSPMVEIRSGFPYSAVNERREFVGPRNQAGRFPPLATLDVRLVRAFKIWKWTAEIGVRAYHLLNSFTPREVQANVDAPDYGAFYNTIPRNWGFTLQFRK